MEIGNVQNVHTYTAWLSGRAARLERVMANATWVQGKMCLHCVVLLCHSVLSLWGFMHIVIHNESNSETFQEVGKVRLDHSSQINLLLSSQKTTLQQHTSGWHSR